MTDRPYREIQIRNAALLITEEITKFVADQDRLEKELEELRVCKAELEIELCKKRSVHATLNKAFASLEESFNRVTAQLDTLSVERDRLVELRNGIVELSTRKAPSTTIPAPPPTED